jgi:hypothetical protein
MEVRSMEITVANNVKLVLHWRRPDCLALEVWEPITSPAESRHILTKALVLTDNGLARFLAFLDTHEEPEPPLAA